MALHHGVGLVVVAADRPEPDGHHFGGQRFGANHQDPRLRRQLVGQQVRRALRAGDDVGLSSPQAEVF